MTAEPATSSEAVQAQCIEEAMLRRYSCETLKGYVDTSARSKAPIPMPAPTLFVA